MEYLEAPDYLDSDPMPAVFLAGGITGCPDWQAEMRELLEPLPEGIMYNPRRKDFDMDDPDATPVQIKWEFDHLWKSDVVIFWFCKETVQPIVLLELGERLAHVRLFKESDMSPAPKLLIGIEPGYEREQDVIEQYKLACEEEPVISRTLQDLVDRFKNLDF